MIVAVMIVIGKGSRKGVAVMIWFALASINLTNL